MLAQPHFPFVRTDLAGPARKASRHALVLLFASTLVVAPLTAAQLSAPAFSASSAAGWQRQEPQPTPWVLRDVDMVSAMEGWTVSSPVTGDHGTILHTIDGGVSWIQQGGLFRQLQTVSFADRDHGVALGNELRYTINGGATWKSGAGVQGSFYDVEMANVDVGYAIGLGRVIKTTDGGANWTSTDLPVDGNLVQVDVVDANTVFVVGATAGRSGRCGRSCTRTTEGTPGPSSRAVCTPSRTTGTRSGASTPSTRRGRSQSAPGCRFRRPRTPARRGPSGATPCIASA